MARRIVLNGMVETGAVIVPAPAMVAVGQTWLAAAIVGIALIASVAQSRSRARATAERQQRLLSSAEHAWNIGADPTPVVKAMQGSAEEDDPCDGSPDDGEPGPWYHRPPSRRG